MVTIMEMLPGDQNLDTPALIIQAEEEEVLTIPQVQVVMAAQVS
jgi:hypothetical protein